MKIVGEAKAQVEPLQGKPAATNTAWKRQMKKSRRQSIRAQVNGKPT